LVSLVRKVPLIILWLLNQFKKKDFFKRVSKKGRIRKRWDFLKFNLKKGGRKRPWGLRLLIPSNSGILLGKIIRGVLRNLERKGGGFRQKGKNFKGRFKGC